MTFTPIDPSTLYDRDNLVNARAEVGDLEGSLQAIRQDPFNVQIRENLGSILMHNKDHFVGIAPDTVRTAAEPAAKEGRSSLEKYALNNSIDVYNDIPNFEDSKDDLVLPFLMHTKLRDDKSDDEYHSFVEASEKSRKMKAVLSGVQTGRFDEKDLRKVVGEVLGYEGWKKGLLAASNDSVYLARLAQEADQISEQNMIRTVVGDDGKPDADKVMKIFDKSYELATDKKDKAYFGAVVDTFYQK